MPTTCSRTRARRSSTQSSRSSTSLHAPPRAFFVPAGGTSLRLWRSALHRCRGLPVPVAGCCFRLIAHHGAYSPARRWSGRRLQLQICREKKRSEEVVKDDQRKAPTTRGRSSLLQITMPLIFLLMIKRLHHQKKLQKKVELEAQNMVDPGSKQVEIGNKLCEDGKKYGVENTCTSGSTLSRAALSFAKARSLMEKERANLLKAFGTQGLADHKDQPALELLSAQIYNLKVQPALVSTIFGDRVVRPRLQTIKVSCVQLYQARSKPWRREGASGERTPGDSGEMVQRLTYWKWHRYATKSNQTSIVKTLEKEEFGHWDNISGRVQAIVVSPLLSWTSPSPVSIFRGSEVQPVEWQRWRWWPFAAMDEPLPSFLMNCARTR